MYFTRGRITALVILALVLTFPLLDREKMASPPLQIFSFPSPNFDDRPPGVPVDTVVIHATERDSAAEVIRIFETPQYKVSSHYTIDRDGTILQHVKDDKRAWHAGVSLMPDGRQRVNDFSIGIELVNKNDGVDPYPQSQLQALTLLLNSLAQRHSIRFVVTHKLIAQPPGRKSDPAGLLLSSLKVPTSVVILG